MGVSKPDHHHARPQDLKFYMQVFGDYAHLSRNEAVRRVANENNLDWSTVSRMVVRASKAPDIHTQLLEYMRQASFSTPASNKIQQLISASTKAQKEFHTSLCGLQYAVFMSDAHFPRVRLDALQLYYDIIADIQPAYISALNDALDFPKISEHVDKRSLSEQQLDSDISQALEMYKYHLYAERRIVPNAMRIAIVGNHEDRLMRHINSGVTDYNAANVMQDLFDSGVLFLDDLRRENAFALNDVLVWGHGWSAASTQSTVARRAFEASSRWLHKPRHVYDVVTGHTHRTAVTRNGVAVHYNSGCMCELDPAYMRTPPNWQLGITISLFDPHGDYHNTQIVEFVRVENRLTAMYNGKSYSTEYKG